MWRGPQTVGELSHAFFTARAQRLRFRCDKDTKGAHNARLRCMPSMAEGAADSQRHANLEPAVPLQAAAELLTLPATCAETSMQARLWLSVGKVSTDREHCRRATWTA